MWDEKNNLSWAAGFNVFCMNIHMKKSLFILKICANKSPLQKHMFFPPKESMFWPYNSIIHLVFQTSSANIHWSAITPLKRIRFSLVNIAKGLGSKKSSFDENVLVSWKREHFQGPSFKHINYNEHWAERSPDLVEQHFVMSRFHLVQAHQFQWETMCSNRKLVTSDLSKGLHGWEFSRFTEMEGRHEQNWHTTTAWEKKM